MRPRVLFVNGGILGLLSFHQFLQRMLPTPSVIEWEHVLLTEGLTLRARAVRRLLATRLWKDGLLGVSNLDLARFRLELFAGLPAVGTRENAVPEIVRHRETGLIVPVGDRAALIAAMDTLAGSPEVRERLGRGARTFIEQTADPVAYLAKLIAILLEAARHGARRRA